MRGDCLGCNVNLPAQNFVGYNVRMGEITEAICGDCLRHHLSYDESVRKGWFSLALQRILKYQGKNADNVVLLRGARDG